MKQNGDAKIFALSFVLLTALFILGESLSTPAYPEPVLLELPATGQAAVKENENQVQAVPPAAAGEEPSWPESEQWEPSPQYPVLEQEENTSSYTYSTGGEYTGEVYSFPMSINQAQKEQLMYVKGVGEKTAEKILEYLAQYGPVSSIEELEAIKGVGPKTVEKLKQYFYAP